MLQVNWSIWGNWPAAHDAFFSPQSLEPPQVLPLTRFSDFGRVLQRYPAAYRPEPAHRPQSRSIGFSGAGVWRIETGAGPFALRAMPPESIDRDRLSELHRLIAHTHECGVMQISVPVVTSDGETFFACDGWIWQLEPWMPGSADFWSQPGAPRLAAAMTCLARWHLAAVRFVPRTSGSAWFFTSPARSSPGLAERLAQISRWDAPARDLVRAQFANLAWPQFAALGAQILDHFESLAPRVAARLVTGLSAAVPVQPCLRDVWHDHLLFTGDEITGLIDLHAARSDSVGTDLARLLGSLVGDGPARWDAGLAAYQLVRPLSLDELALVELFDQSAVLLSGMTWIDWCCVQRRNFADRDRVISRLQTIVDRMKHLATK